jgi:hypothetical protein
VNMNQDCKHWDCLSVKRMWLGASMDDIKCSYGDPGDVRERRHRPVCER